MTKLTYFFYIFIFASLIICFVASIFIANAELLLIIAFACISLLISLFLIFRGFKYKIDTNILLGFVLLSVPCCLLLEPVFANFFYYLACIAFFFSLGFFIIRKYFKDKKHIISFFVFLTIFAISMTGIYLTKFVF